MHPDKAERVERDPSVALLDLPLPADPLAMPTAWGFVLGPPRFLHEEGPFPWLRSPGCECLPDSARARDSRDEPDAVLQAYPKGTATLGLTLGYQPTDPSYT